MKILILGLGYVGCTLAACLSRDDHVIIGVDVNRSKVDKINAGEPPISEPGMAELFAAAHKAGQLFADVAIGDHIKDCDLAVVCVGTPSAPDGSHNMGFIAEVTRQIAEAAAAQSSDKRLAVAYRSTVRPGTMDELVTPIFRQEMGEAASRIDIVYNPEFLREASAIYDYDHPPKIVVGTLTGEASPVIDKLYEKIEAPRFNVKFRDAEFIKFVDNSWHAVKVTFANEVGRLCALQGVSATAVHEIFTSDTKLNISKYYLRPGGAFGGSCLPKDVRALQYIAADVGAHTHLIDSLVRSNEAHKHFQYEQVTAGLEPGASVLLVGLAFKAHTDDLRESPNIDIARKLLRDGYKLSIYDPAIEPAALVGQNLGYMYSQLPMLQSLLVDRATAEATSYDLIVSVNDTVKSLSVGAARHLDLSRIA